MSLLLQILSAPYQSFISHSRSSPHNSTNNREMQYWYGEMRSREHGAGGACEQAEVRGVVGHSVRDLEGRRACTEEPRQ